jgi:hypothetical protein
MRGGGATGEARFRLFFCYNSPIFTRAVLVSCFCVCGGEWEWGGVVVRERRGRTRAGAEEQVAAEQTRYAPPLPHSPLFPWMRVRASTWPRRHAKRAYRRGWHSVGHFSEHCVTVLPSSCCFWFWGRGVKVRSARAGAAERRGRFCRLDAHLDASAVPQALDEGAHESRARGRHRVCVVSAARPAARRARRAVKRPARAQRRRRRRRRRLPSVAVVGTRRRRQRLEGDHKRWDAMRSVAQHTRRRASGGRRARSLSRSSSRRRERRTRGALEEREGRRAGISCCWCRDR